MGLELSDLAAVEVYEENWPAWELFTYMQTQWNVGPGGIIGYRYEVAHHKLDRARLDPEEYEIRMEELRIMESAALTAMRSQQKEK